MEKNYELVFDEVILRQLEHAGKNEHLRSILSNIFDKIEEKGPRAGKLVDSKLFIYEIKLKHPPLRVYYKHNKLTNEIYLFEYEMKTSPKKQKRTLTKLRRKALET